MSQVRTVKREHLKPASSRARLHPESSPVKHGVGSRQKQQGLQDGMISKTVLNTREAPPKFKRPPLTASPDAWGDGLRMSQLTQSAPANLETARDAEATKEKLKQAYGRLGLANPPGAVRESARKQVQKVLLDARPDQSLFVTDCSLETMQVRIVRKKAARQLSKEKSVASSSQAAGKKQALPKKWMPLESAKEWKGSRLDVGRSARLKETVERMRDEALAAYNENYEQFLKDAPKYIPLVIGMLEKALQTEKLDADDLFAVDKSVEAGRYLSALMIKGQLPDGPHSPEVLGDVLRRLLDAVQPQLFSIATPENLAALASGHYQLFRGALASLPQDRRALVKVILDFLSKLDDPEACGDLLGHVVFRIGDPFSPQRRTALANMIRDRKLLFAKTAAKSFAKAAPLVRTQDGEVNLLEYTAPSRVALKSLAFSPQLTPKRAKKNA